MMCYGVQQKSGQKHRRAVCGGILIFSILLSGAVHADDWSLAERLYSDVKARKVGDLVTIVIDEASTMSRASTQAGDKSSSGSGSASFAEPYVSSDGTAPSSLGSATLPAFNWSLQNSFSGDGSMSSSDDFEATVSARVIDVLPNGTLLLEGKRTVRLQKENVNVVLSGLVRPKDISSNNQVMSSRLADASIRYETDGPLSRISERGLFTRLINWINPF